MEKLPPEKNESGEERSRSSESSNATADSDVSRFNALTKGLLAVSQAGLKEEEGKYQLKKQKKQN